jgi:hypothetical protein
VDGELSAACAEAVRAIHARVQELRDANDGLLRERGARERAGLCLC